MFGYTEPPPYDGIEYDEERVPRCRVKMTIPPHPTLYLWQPIEVNVVGHRLADTFEATAMEAIHVFYDQHPEEVVGHPIGLFPAIDSRDLEWTFRVTYYDHLLGSLAGETLRTAVSFMNAQYRYQTLQQHGIYRLTSIAQGYRNQIGRQNMQIEEKPLSLPRKRLLHSRMKPFNIERIRLQRAMLLLSSVALSLTFSRSKFMSSTLILAKLLTVSTCFMSEASPHQGRLKSVDLSVPGG
jgi:hypothetical protein